MPFKLPRLIRTKVLATLGPATDSDESLRRLIDCGAAAFRLNFSHGTFDAHTEHLARIRRLAAKLGISIATVGDLCGPKIRLGSVDEPGGMIMETGDVLAVHRGPVAGVDRNVTTNYEQLVDEVQVGQRLLIDDGAVRFIVTEKQPDRIICRCTASGVILTRKGVNLPDTELSVASLTDYDWQCVRWAVEHELDYLALSFVRRADALLELRRFLVDSGPPGAGIQLIAKIEKPEAVSNIGSIIEASDVIMVARGDLGVEMDVARVPIVQKELIRRCRQASKPVIVATQMLQTMIDSASPTRAEVSDVANAVYDGADVVMLSGETAVGKYPALVVQTMSHIAQVTEEYLFGLPLAWAHEEETVGEVANAVEASLAWGACQMVRSLDCRLIVAWSQSGVLARFFSKLRPAVPVVALTSEPAVARRTALYFGVIARTMPVPESLDQLIPAIDRLLLGHEMLEPGDPILIVGGTALGHPGAANAIVVHRVARAVPGE